MPQFKNRQCKTDNLYFDTFSYRKEKTETTENSNTMLKLYKLTENQLHYWETWDKEEKTAIIHWGIVGQRGQDNEVKKRTFLKF
jgi:hypothetical protein